MNNFKLHKNSKRFLILGVVAFISIILSHIIVYENISSFMSGFGMALLVVSLIATMVINKNKMV